jgi:phenylpropionate dioxygenase-like ring-hydroxylating dioxygenase large terminal subunit
MSRRAGAGAARHLGGQRARDRTRRTPYYHAMTSRYPFPACPEGWFRVAWSSELGKTGVLPVRWLGHELVLYRAEDGRAHMLDAFCPHLGAHLGHGGRVEGDGIVCPFHGWRMGKSGACEHAPGARKLPLRAVVGRWQVREVGGAVLAYFHPDRVEPSWEPREIGGEGFTRRLHPKRWRIRSHVQEMGENAVDLAHAAHLHRHITHGAQTTSVEIDGAVLRHRAEQEYSVFPLLEWLGRRVLGVTQVTCQGLGLITIEAHVEAGIELDYRVEFYPTPVDDGTVELDVSVSMRPLASRLATELLLAKAAREAVKTIEQDVPIWENKRFTARPILIEGERAIADYRRWVRRFYPQERQRLACAT